MSLSDTIAYDATHVVCNAAEFGETTRYSHSSLADAYLEVTAVWGEVAVGEALGNGFADVCEVSIPVASFVDAFGTAVVPTRHTGASSAQLKRYPSAWASGGDEDWDVARVTRSGAVYLLEVYRNVRATP